jgi:hypothetical protein
MLELDYKEKSILLDYYIEIGTNIVNLIKDNNQTGNNFKLSEDKLVEQILTFVREKQKDYKTRSTNMKDKNIFEFLDRGKATFDNTNNLNSSLNLMQQSRDMNSFKIRSGNEGSLGGQFRSTDNNLMRSGHKMATVESRYNEEDDDKPVNTVSNLTLSNDIMNKIDDNNKNLIYVINDFLSTEKTTLEASFEEIENDKKIYSGIRAAVQNNTLMNPMKNYQSSLYSYMQILDDDKDKINHKEVVLHNKLKVFGGIESITESFYSYIKIHSSELNEKRMEISEKLVMIKGQIDEYMKLFYEPKGVNVYDGDTIKGGAKIGSSIDFLIAQKYGRHGPSDGSEFRKFYSLYDRRDVFSGSKISS